MKITHNKIGQNLDLKDSGAVDKSKQTNGKSVPAAAVPESKSSASESARVELSPRAKEMQKIKEAATSAPDVDMAKVEKFRGLIDSGNYKVDAKAVANKMIDEELALAGANEASE